MTNSGFAYFKYMAAAFLMLLIAAVSVACSNKAETAERSSVNVDSVSEDAGSAEPATATPKPTPTLTPTPTPEPTATPIPTPTSTPTPTPDLHIGEVRSTLDGSWISEETAQLRPYAVMLNNHTIANPQSSIGEAKIVYEALVEGSMTRLMAIFEGLTSESSCADRIGSIRSARHYFASVADEYDAIFIHFGQAKYALDTFEKLDMDHLDCMSGYGVSMYYRDSEIAAPHNAFATVARIEKAIKSSGMRSSYQSDRKVNHFTVAETSVYPASGDAVYDDLGAIIDYDGAQGSDASLVKLSYSSYMSPYFTYDPETQVYTRYQYGDVHIDYNTGEALTFTNIIIQIVHEYNKDKNGYQDMDIEENTGTGYFISMGQCIPIKWEKSEDAHYMMYTYEDGSALSINPGKSFISLFPDYRTSKLVIE